MKGKAEMKIAMAQINPVVADIEGNRKKILKIGRESCRERV